MVRVGCAVWSAERADRDQRLRLSVVAVLTTSSLTMQFGAQRALDSLDVEVPNGVTGLVGANGAGNTTLMSIALGLRAPTSGEI